MERFFVYRVTNKINGKLYIGKTSTSPEHRWQQHLAAARKGPDDHHRYQYFHRALNKHGVENFRFEVVGEYDSEAECAQAEIDLIAQHESNVRNKGYNLTAGGDGASGYRHTARAKRIMSARKKNDYLGKGNPFFGRKHSRQTRRTIAEKAKLRTGRLNSFHGRRHSEESLEKMREHHHDKPRYLTEGQVDEARRLFSTAQYTHSQLAERFGVTPYVVEKAICGRGAYANVGQQLPRRPNGWINSSRPTARLLTDDEVAGFRRRRRKGEALATLANERGVSDTLISIAVRGRPPYDEVDCGEPPVLGAEVSASLSDKDVEQARQLYSTGKYTYEKLAKKFGVSKHVVVNAVRGKGRYGKIGKPLEARFGRWTKTKK